MNHWDDLREQLKYAEMLLDELHIPSSSEYDRHEAHMLTGKLVDTPFVPGTAKMFQRHWPGEAVWRERINILVNDVNEHYKNGELRNIIRASFDAAEITLETLNAWRMLESLCGRFVEIQEFEKTAYGQFKRSVASGASTKMKAHNCWYAHCLQKYGVLDLRNERETAQKELADLCIDAHLGIIRSNINPEFYDEAWFRRALTYRDKEGSKVKKGMYDAAK